MQQIYRRTPMPKCEFDKVVLQFYWNHTSAWVSPVKLLHIFQTHFPKNTYGGLLLILDTLSIIKLDQSKVTPSHHLNFVGNISSKDI